MQITPQSFNMLIVGAAPCYYAITVLELTTKSDMINYMNLLDTS